MLHARNTGPSLTAGDEDDCMIIEPSISQKAVTETPAAARVLSDANGKRKRRADTALSSDTEKKLKTFKPNSDVILLD